MQKNNIKFEQITLDQQTEVLKYIQATNTEDLNEATALLSNFNFDYRKAISNRYDNSTTHNQERSQALNNQAEKQYTDYFLHIQKLHQERTLVKLLTGCSYFIARKIFRKIISLIPSMIKQKIYDSEFDCLYKETSKVDLDSTTLPEVFHTAKQNEKPCAIIIAPNKNTHPRITQILSSYNYYNILNLRFICYGITFCNTKQLKMISQQPKVAKIIFAYQTIFNKKKILRSYNLQQEQKENDFIPNSLNQVIQQYRLERRHQKNIIIRYNNTVLSRFTDETSQNLIEEQVRQDPRSIQTDRYIRQQQMKQYQEAIATSKRLQQEQNSLKKKKQQQQSNINSLIQQRKIRALSIPDQPLIGDFIKFCFRCPDGSKIFRNFQVTQKVELLYDWVETNQKIEFEDNIKREFEILRSYPPVPLKTEKDKFISTVFDEPQQLLTIKQI